MRTRPGLKHVHLETEFIETARNSMLAALLQNALAFVRGNFVSPSVLQARSETTLTRP